MRKRILSKKIAATFLVVAMMAVPVLSGATAFAADEGNANEGAEVVNQPVTVDASSEDKTVEVGKVKSPDEGVVVTANNGNKATVDTGDIVAGKNGVLVNNINNSSVVDVNTGNIINSNKGINVNDINGNSAVKVETENVSSSSNGIIISDVYGSSVEVDTKNISSNINGIIIDNIYDTGVDDKSVIKVKTGDIKANSYCIDSNIQSSGSVDIEVNGSATSISALGISLVQHNKGTTNLIVKGDVINTYTNAFELYQRDEGKTNVVVEGNVEGRLYGVLFASNSEKATADVLVGGTMSGGYAPVIFNGYNSSIDNLAKCISLTAWRIIPNINGDVVELDYYTGRHPEMKEEFEKNIMYIIKVEQPTEGGKISLTDKNGNALATSYDYEVANEGDIVKINPEKGYKLTAVYNGVDGNKLDVIPDSDGNYYVQVPKGGGVYLTATLEKEKYDISFYDEEGNLIQTNNVEYGSTITIPNAPTKDGYEFLYWEGSKYYPGDQYTVTGPHTFKAIWKKVEEKSADNKDDDSSADKKDENTAADSDSKTTDNISDKAIDSSDSKTNEAASSAETATNISRPVASASPATADNTNLLMVFIVMMLSASCAALAGNLKHKLNK